MVVKRLESFLFDQLNLVGVDPFQRIGLFDLLVKKERAGINCFSSSVRLANLGSFLDYRLDPQSDFLDLDGDSYESLIRRGSTLLDEDKFRTDFEDREEGKVFKVCVDFGVEYNERISTSTTLGVKALHYFGGRIGSSNEMEYRIVSPSCQAIRDDVLGTLFVGPTVGEGLWKPDVEKIKRSVRDLALHDGNLEMWIVKERMYSDVLEVNEGHQASAGVFAAAHEIAPGAEISVDAGKSKTARKKIDGPFIVGFRAIRLFFDNKGNLLQWCRNDMGENVPTVRNTNEESTGFNDYDFHMEGLFADQPLERGKDTPRECPEIEIHDNCTIMES